MREKMSEKLGKTILHVCKDNEFKGKTVLKILEIIAVICYVKLLSSHIPGYWWLVAVLSLITIITLFIVKKDTYKISLICSLIKIVLLILIRLETMSNSELVTTKLGASYFILLLVTILSIVCSIQMISLKRKNMKRTFRANGENNNESNNQECNEEINNHEKQKVKGFAELISNIVDRKQQDSTIKIIRSIAIGIILIIGVTAFLLVGKSSENYKSIALNYLNAYVECDWNTVYSTVNLPKSEFLTVDLLKKAKSMERVEEINSYNVKEASGTADEEMEADQDSKRKSVVTFQYNLKDSQIDKTQSIVMDKLEKSNLLFFDKYTVSAENIMIENTRITVRKEAKLFVDDIEVADTYLSKDDVVGESYKTYLITYLFKGIHSFKIIQQNMEDQEIRANITDNERDLSYCDARIRSEVKEQLQANGEVLIEKLHSSFVEHKDFSEVKSLFTTDSDTLIKMASKYRTIMENVTLFTGNGYEIISFSSNNTNINPSQTVDNKNKPGVKVTVYPTYRATIVSPIDNKSRNIGGSIRSVFYYTYQDGDWKLYDFEINYPISTNQTINVQ